MTQSKTLLETNAVSPDGGGNGHVRPPSTLQFSEEDFRDFLLQLSNQAGCVAELARRLDVSGQFLGDVISGKKRAGKKILDKLGGNIARVYIIPVEADV